MRCALSTAGPTPQRIAAGARGVRTIVPQYDVRTTGRRGSKTYGKNRHGGDGDGGDDGGDNGDGGGDDGGGEGEGVGVGIMGRQPTNLGVAILA